MKRIHFKTKVYYFSVILMLVLLNVFIVKISRKTEFNNQNEPSQSVIAPPYENKDTSDKTSDTIDIYDYFSNAIAYEVSQNAPQESTSDEEIANDRTIRQTTFGIQDGGCFVRLTSGAQVKNYSKETSQCLYAQSNLLPDYTIDTDGTPQVLILHTHTTEGYQLEETEYYDEAQNARFNDEASNVIAVGEEIARAIQNSGIGVIHNKTYHDYPSYSGCYERSAETTRAILEQHPTIKVVLDIHRDSITAIDGTKIAPVVEIDRTKAAQARIISGCDDGTLGIPNYMQNFRLACLIQNKTERTYPGLMRPVEFDFKKYNQDITTGSLTIEVGSAANSLEQAKYTGRLLGETIANALLSIATQN